jgi:hypothetical protein
MNKSIFEINQESKIVADVAGFIEDPLGFILFAFRWGEGALKGHEGPDEWQREVLEEIGLAIRSGNTKAFQAAVASGHGIGKGALSAWIIIWAMATRPHLNGVVTANTKVQLETKTWRELAVWHKRCLVRDWFEWTATKFYHVDHPETWFTAAIPWSEKNPEAFAGQHSEHVLIIYDEASAIPDTIWEVSEGAMTTPGAMRFAFGNPTRNTGRFRECFGKFKHRWLLWQIDSRSCRMTDKRKLDEWIEDYGEDSDFVKVRVRGEFPSASSMQFISNDIVEMARERETRSYPHEPLIIGVDVARFGDDQSVICFRRGRDARTIPWKKYRGLDTMQLAARVTEAVADFQPTAVFVDGGGVGGGVVDRLRSLHTSVIEVNFGSKAADPRYNNKRAEMWGRMKEWLTGGVIPKDRDLHDDLIGVEYGYTITNQIQLEKKDDMKKRGLASPDFGDALALTFAYPVAPKGIETGPNEAAKARREYNPLYRNRKHR